MLSRKRILTALLALTLLAIALLVFILHDKSGRTILPPAPLPSAQMPQVTTDSSATNNAAAFPPSYSDSDIATDVPSSRSVPKAMLPVSFDSTVALFAPHEPELDDTLQRYGARATNMQMLIELLEEKQLLMEEKVELSRRLEIVEILDSVALGRSPSDTLAPAQPLADSLRYLGSHPFASPARLDSSKSAATIPPRN